MVDRPENYKGLYGILQLLQGSHLDNFFQKSLKLGWVAFHSLTSQQEPITWSLQLLHILFTAFSQTDLFLVEFISNSDSHSNLTDQLQS